MWYLQPFSPVKGWQPPYCYMEVPGSYKFLATLIALLYVITYHTTLKRHSTVFSLCDDIVTGNHFSHYWPFVSGIYQSPADSHHKGPVMQTLQNFDILLNCHDNILHTLCQWHLHNIDETINSQRTPHISASQVSYGMSFLSIYFRGK